MNAEEASVILLKGACFGAFRGIPMGCENLHRRCGGTLGQPVENLLAGVCKADAPGLRWIRLFFDQSRLFSHLRACVSICSEILCTKFPPLSPVCVDPPVSRLWKTSSAPRPARLAQPCSNNDQQWTQLTDPQVLFPNGGLSAKLSTMPVGRISQKVWTTCTQIAEGLAGRGSVVSGRFLINCRKSDGFWLSAIFAGCFPHWLCSVLPGRCGRVVDGSL